MALLTSILTGGVNNHPTTSEEANFYTTDFVNSGVVGTFTNTSGVAPMTGAFALNAQGTPDMTVAVTAGAAYVTATPAGQNSQRLRVRLTANQNVTIASNSSGSTKYDWVYINIDATLANAPTLAGDTVSTLVVSRSTSSTADNGTPPTYGLLLGVVTVANGAASITNSVIRDARVQASTTSVDTSITTGWLSNQLPAVSGVTANGNRSYSITFGSTVASTLSSGMRLRTTRTVAAPTQCTSLNGTTQYWSKATPNKLTFTDDFVVSAWIKVSSYAQSGIVSCYNGTSGWALQMNASGQIILGGFNAGAGNYSQVSSYQSVPLNKWVHITAQLDMSTFTATTTTSYIMFDGKDVPATVSRGGTNPTALIQAGNLNIGAYNSGAFFPGKIAQAAIYNAKVTQATILASINQGLSGSETNLASAYSFSNSFTDLNTTTPNDLTANGSAVATNADSPFGNAGTSSTLDYALVQAVSTTTATVQVPEGCTIPTSGGVTSVAYSVQGNPYGWVSDKNKWRINQLWKTDTNQASNATFAAYTGFQLIVGTGNWEVGYGMQFFNASTTKCFYALSPTSITGLAGTAIDNTLEVNTQASSAAIYFTYAKISRFESLSSQTTYLLYSLGATTSAGTAGASGSVEIFAIPQGL